MPLNVHIQEDYHDIFAVNLKKRLDDDIIVTIGDNIPEPPAYDILVCGVPDRKAIEASPGLKHLIIPWAGLPRKTRDLMARYPDITVHNSHHNAVPAAEMAFLLMYALCKDIINTDRSFRNNDWSPRYYKRDISLLSGKKTLILGYGAIGREIAKRCAAFNMEVTAVNRSGGVNDKEKIKIYPQSELDKLLPSTEVLFLSLPLTDNTKKLFDRKRLALLPDGAVLINISRGPIIDELALYEFLKGRNVKAGLDVWYNYPETIDSRRNTKPSQYPFNELPNVIMTPHLAEHTDKTEIMRAEEIAGMLNLAARGQPLPNLVDLNRGY